ncbi:MAG: hypothetical protein V8R49_01415 [Duodenibacillus massiliensis]
MPAAPGAGTGVVDVGTAARQEVDVIVARASAGMMSGGLTM